MPSGMYEVEVDLPIYKVWDFVKDMDNWAPLILGYIQHKRFTNRQSLWEFYSDIGIIKKKISLMVTITEWIEPTKVTFSLEGENGKLKGGGYYLAEAIGENKTKITGYLDINAKGPMGPMVNKVLVSYLPKVTKEMVMAIAAKLEA